MHLVFVMGNRPQFIKFAPLYHHLKQSGVTFHVIHTLQHHDTLLNQAIFQDLELPAPDFQLPLPIPTGNAFVDKATRFIGECLDHLQPDCAVVFGDTHSTLAGALAASKMNITLAHIEAGLRSNNYDMPEEFNRRMADYLSDVLFAPTHAATQNLKNENLSGKVYQSGDLMLDAFLLYKAKASPPKTALPKSFCLATVHRNFNTDQPNRLDGIVEQLNRIHKHLCPVILPTHPRLQKALSSLKVNVEVRLLPPVPYLNMLWLLQHCQFVITDSGGLQKEAFFARKPCLLPRAETEWGELLANGNSRLTEPEYLYEETLTLMARKATDYPEIFGNGNASSLIAQRLMALLE